MAREGAAAPLAVTAARQTEGRGRSGNDWDSGSGNLAVSILIRPGVPPASAAQSGLVAAVAAADFVQAYAPDASVGIKWPNDVLIDDRKLVGILPEASVDMGAIDWIVVGIGINLVSAPPGAGVLFDDVPPEREVLEDRLISIVLQWVDVWERDGFEPVRRAWLGRCVHKGRRLRVRLPDDVFEADFLDIEGTGALKVRLDSGENRVISAGEVFSIPER